MEAGVSDGKHGDDVLSITCKFLQSMWESKRGCPDGSVPGNRPLSSVLDNFRGLNRSKSEFEVSEFFHFELIVHCGKLSAEYGVQIDGFPSDDVSPLRIREFWTTGQIGE